MDKNQKKKIAGAAAGGLAGAFTLVVLHPLIPFALVGAGGYAGYKALSNRKNKGPKQ